VSINEVIQDRFVLFMSVMFDLRNTRISSLLERDFIIEISSESKRDERDFDLDKQKSLIDFRIEPMFIINSSNLSFCPKVIS
jgi:hypothetical protein